MAKNCIVSKVKGTVDNNFPKQGECIVYVQKGGYIKFSNSKIYNVSITTVDNTDSILYNDIYYNHIELSNETTSSMYKLISFKKDMFINIKNKNNTNLHIDIHKVSLNITDAIIKVTNNFAVVGIENDRIYDTCDFLKIENLYIWFTVCKFYNNFFIIRCDILLIKNCKFSSNTEFILEKRANMYIENLSDNVIKITCNNNSKIYPYESSAISNSIILLGTMLNINNIYTDVEYINTKYSVIKGDLSKIKNLYFISQQLVKIDIVKKYPDYRIEYNENDIMNNYIIGIEQVYFKDSSSIDNYLVSMSNKEIYPNLRNDPWYKLINIICHEPRTSRSDTAVAMLQQKGYTVSVSVFPELMTTTQTYGASEQSDYVEFSNKFKVAYKDNNLYFPVEDSDKAEINVPADVNLVEFDTLEEAQNFVNDNNLMYRSSSDCEEYNN